MITVSHLIVRAMADNGSKGIGKRVKGEEILFRQQQIMRQRLQELKNKN